MIDFHTEADCGVPNAQLKAAFCTKSIDHACELNIASKEPPYRLIQIMGTIGKFLQNVLFILMT